MNQSQVISKKIIVIGSVFFSIYNFFIVILSIIILIYFFKNGFKKHTFNVLFIAFCIGSIIQSAIGAIQVSVIAQNNYFYGNFLCKFTGYLYETINTYFLLSYTYISIHNFLCLNKPNFYNDYKKSIYFSIFIFCSTLLFNIPMLFTFGTVTVNNKIVFIFAIYKNFRNVLELY